MYEYYNLKYIYSVRDRLGSGRNKIKNERDWFSSVTNRLINMRTDLTMCEAAFIFMRLRFSKI